MSNAQPTESLFKELDNAIQSNELDNAITLCDKILKIEPQDEDAFQCKLVALIQLSKFDDALATLKANTSFEEKFLFEKAYCFYRNKKFNDSLTTLVSIPSPKSIRVLELEAQVHYRLEDFGKCISLYESLLNEHNITTPELRTNLAAAHASASAGAEKEAEKFIAGNKAHLDESFELTYNAACCFVNSGDYATAEKYLKQSEKLCRQSMSDEGADAEEIEDEVAVIRTQLAYVYQVTGRTEEALAIYSDVLKVKPSDETVSAVASNNVVVIKKDHDLFDSDRKLKQATSQAVEAKLSPQQKKIIGFNRCLLLLYMNKFDQCRELVKLLQDQFPDADRLALISASLLFREKKVVKSEELLKTFASEHPNSSTLVRLSLAQLYLGKGEVKETIEALQAINELKNKPGMVATLASLYEQIHDIDNAVKVLDNHVAWLESQKTKNEDDFIRLLKDVAAFKLRHKRYREAASSYEKVLKNVGNDLEALPGLIIACSQFDTKLAEKHEGRLPPLADSDQDVDAEALENLAAPRLGNKAQVTEEKVEEKKKAKNSDKKKKKKKKLPKNMDKPLDPERWIPLKERSYFKRKNRGKKLEKGSQGISEKKLAPGPSTPQAAANEKPSKAEVTTPAAAPAQPTPPKQNQQQQKKKGKKRH